MMRFRRLMGTVIVAGSLAAIGCQGNSPPTSANGTSPADRPQDAANVTVQVKSWAETQELVAQNKGKVAIIDLWSTS